MMTKDQLNQRALDKYSVYTPTAAKKLMPHYIQGFTDCQKLYGGVSPEQVKQMIVILENLGVSDKGNDVCSDMAEELLQSLNKNPTT